MASTSNRSSTEWSPRVWTAAPSIGGPGNGGWLSPAQSAIACEASMHIKERKRRVYSARKKKGAQITPHPRGKKRCVRFTYFAGEEKLASPSSTCAHAQ